MVSSVISAFLYLRIVVTMYMVEEQGDEVGAAVRIPFAAGLALALAVVFTIGVGILPQQVVHWADRAIPVVLASGR
jgi:NADH:ubiquinone oxidoreductase subunit 2 (subunit N)